ncbi:transporter [Arcobacter sp. F155]|uniref:TolC family protein n=1 Tax=unclassified Arcobacter TaxID=2593671 RepID=UPI00100BD51E|nr:MULTISPECIES: TolC family protein [unclassified Arcobacter]RXJ77615.1 transporter [Arcobacter sp. F155]RXK01716.1 transporter [Arcobacter sp. CECT 8989]
MKKSILAMFLPLILLGQNLDELVELSLKNQLINSYEYDTDSIKKEYESVKSSYYPKLDVSATYSNTNEETPSVPNDGIRSSASINFVLYDGNKRSNTFSKYRSNIKSSQESLNSSKNQIALDVSSYYFNYLALLAQKEAKLKQIDQLKAQEERLSKFLAVGSTTKDEVEKIISRVESENVNLHSIELDLQTILSNLEYITGKKISISEGSMIKDYQVTQDSQRADIKALEYDVKAQFDNAKVEKSGYLPTITLDNTYTDYDYNYDNSAYESIEDQNIFSVNMKWNLFSFGETKNRYEAQYKKYLSLKSRYEYERNRANTDLQLAQRAFNIAKLKVKSANASLKAATSAYEVIKSKYENGLIENVAYLEALSEKYDAMSLLEFAKYDLEIKKANIIYHSGENLKDYIR